MDKVFIGNNIKAIRKEHSLSQKDFGLLFGFSARTVSDWECGNTEPDLTTIKNIVSHFGLTYEELLD